MELMVRFKELAGGNSGDAGIRPSGVRTESNARTTLEISLHSQNCTATILVHRPGSEQREPGVARCHLHHPSALP